jgi:hypothetical protein
VNRRELRSKTNSRQTKGRAPWVRVRTRRATVYRRPFLGVALCRGRGLGDQTTAATATDLAALATGRPRLICRPLVGGSLFVGCATTLACDFTLLFRGHGCKPATFFTFCTHRFPPWRPGVAQLQRMSIKIGAKRDAEGMSTKTRAFSQDMLCRRESPAGSLQWITTVGLILSTDSFQPLAPFKCHLTLVFSDFLCRSRK